MAPSSVVYALDFDGVICDSCGESAQAAFLAAKKVWPEILDVPRWTEMPTWMEKKMRELRPVIETGYENVMLIRLLVQEARAAENSSRGTRPLTVGEIMANWQDLKDKLLRDWGASKEELIEAFGGVRDDWMERDLQSWIDANRLYPGVADALNFATKPLFIITTKQKRFVVALLAAFGVTNVNTDNIFGLGSGSKISVIKNILAREEFKGWDVHFVEDRLETLESAALSLLGKPVHFYLADWGYNTADAKHRASRNPTIEVIDLQRFTTTMR